MRSALFPFRSLAALALAVIASAFCASFPGAAQATAASTGGVQPLPAGYTVAADPAGPEVTIRTRFSLGGQEGPLHLTLAGLGPSAGSPPANLALTIDGRTSGWFGFVGHLRLESSAGWLPAGLAQASQQPASQAPFISLKNVALAPGPTYEATLSYNGATGIASVSLRNVTADSTLYEGHLHVRAVREPQFAGFFGSDGSIEAAAERLGLHVALQGGVELSLIGEDHEPQPLTAAPSRTSADSPVAVYRDQPVRIAVSGIGPGLPGEFRLTIAKIPTENETSPPATGAPVVHAWPSDAGRADAVAQIPAGALSPGLYRLAVEYFEPDYSVRVAEGGIRVIDGRIRAQLMVEHNRPWESGGRMSGELVLVSDRDLGAVDLEVTAAPDGRESQPDVVWRERLDLRRDEPARIPLSFVVSAADLPQVLRVALAGEASERIALQAGYHIPRTFYVSPHGDDSWTGHLPEPAPGGARGTGSGPFRTIARAQRAIRELKAADRLQGPVTVYLRGGTYFLSEPLTFTSADSGTAAAPITYAAYPGETPVLSGGVPVTEWERRDGEIWAGKLSLPPQSAGIASRGLRTLRVGDQWATLARYPDADPADPLYGGWLFAQWWGEPWERGAFDVAVGNIHNAGDRLEWDVQVPAEGEYAVWIRYSHNMSAFGIPAMDDRTTLQVGDGAPVRLKNLPDTGGWGTFRWTLAGTLRIPAGEQRLVWRNVSGGGYNLDALALSDDPNWHPETGIRSGGDGQPYLVKEPGAHVLVIQAEAAARAIGREITIPQFPQITGNMNLLRFPRGTFPAWSDWSGAQVHIFPAWGWVNAVVAVTGVDAEKQTLHVDSSQDIRPGNRFFIANVREALDSPGEWYFDRARGEILYWPKEEGFPGGVEVVAALLDRLIVFRGDGPGRFVEHIRLRGLTFTDTDYTAPGGYYSHADAAIWLSRARHIAIEDSHFVNLGGYAVRLDQQSHQNEIVGNTIRRMGQGGVIMLGETASQPYDNLVAANEMSDLGLVYKHVAGVYVTTGSGNRIVHNRIHRVPRYGISLKSYSTAASSHNNLVEFNEIVDSNLETNDTGAIETLGRDQKYSGNIIRFNWIENVVGVASTEAGEIRRPYFTWGIYLDDYSSGTLVYGNIVRGTVLGAICIHGGQDNIVENNIFLEGSERQITLQPRDAFMTRNAFRRNIVVYSNPDALLWYSYSHTWAKERLSEVDANVYWHTGGLNLGQTEKRITPEGTFAAWQAAGFDRGSRIADPLLLGGERDHFGLAPDSPAWELGFERIPVELIGPEGYRRTP